jgi:hypothetical protein
MKSFRNTVRQSYNSISPSFNQKLKFSEQSQSLQDQNLATLKIVIELLSVNDPVVMLQRLLSCPEYKPAASATMDPKYSELLNNICCEFTRAAKFEDKQLLLSLVANLHDGKFLRSVGFIFGNNLFAQAKKYKRFIIIF